MGRPWRGWGRARCRPRTRIHASSAARVAASSGTTRSVSELAERHLQPGAVPGQVPQAVQFQVEELAQPQPGAAQQGDAGPGGRVVEFGDRGHQRGVDVRGQRAGQRRGQSGDVASGAAAGRSGVRPIPRRPGRRRSSRRSATVRWWWLHRDRQVCRAGSAAAGAAGVEVRTPRGGCGTAGPGCRSRGEWRRASSANTRSLAARDSTGRVAAWPRSCAGSAPRPGGSRGWAIDRRAARWADPAHVAVLGGVVEQPSW